MEGANMSSQVVRVQSFGKGSLGGIGKEVERDDKGLINHRNEDIDISRTHLNEFYKKTENGMYADWSDTCKKLNVVNVDKLRKNATAFEGMVITSDTAFFDDLGFVPGEEPPVKVKEFFDKAYEFAKEEIGFKGTDENILAACVHYDETTPHLQLYYVPVVDSWKEKVYERNENGKVLKTERGTPIQARDDKGKIIYKDVVDSPELRLNRTQFWKNKGGRTSYTQMQDRFYDKISKEYGIGRGERGSTKEHTTKAQWEAKQLAEKQGQLEKLKEIDTNVSLNPQKGKLIFSEKEVLELKDQNQALRVKGYEKASKIRELEKEVSTLTHKLTKAESQLSDTKMVKEQLKDIQCQSDNLADYSSKTPKLAELLKPYHKVQERTEKLAEGLKNLKTQYFDAQEEYGLELKNRDSLDKDISDLVKRSVRLTDLKRQCDTAKEHKEALQSDLSDSKGMFKVVDRKNLKDQIQSKDNDILKIGSTLQNEFGIDQNQILNQMHLLDEEKAELEKVRKLHDERADKSRRLMSKCLNDYKVLKVISKGENANNRDIISRRENIPQALNSDYIFKVKRSDREKILETIEGAKGLKPFKERVEKQFMKEDQAEQQKIEEAKEIEKFENQQLKVKPPIDRGPSL